MYSNIFNFLECPKVYKESDTEFWNDDHISKYMLNAHLDPDYEGASRKLYFIENSIKWIREILPVNRYKNLLDIGCGPGLYTERFSKAGYKVTGVDYSKRSIEYARNSSEKQKLDINYIYQNYLNMNYMEEFDLATFIYCDYGVLSDKNRNVILEKIYKSLKPGGRLLLDVFSMKKYKEFQEIKTWEINENGGFWSKEKYIELIGNYKFSKDSTLEQIVIVKDEEIRNYYLWSHYFTEEKLIEEAEKIGFKVVDIFSDVAGKSYSKESETLAILRMDDFFNDRKEKYELANKYSEKLSEIKDNDDDHFYHYLTRLCGKYIHSAYMEWAKEVKQLLKERNG